MESIDENKQLENNVVRKVETEATNTQNVKPEKRENKNYQKTIVFAIMGEKFSIKFMQCWMELFNFCLENGIRPMMSFSGETDPYIMRNTLLGGNMNGGIEQKPFQGKLDYDYIMWLDSETLFNYEQFEMLLAGMEKHEIVSGVSLNPGMQSYNAIVNTDIDELKTNGKYEHVPKERMEEVAKSDNPLLKVDQVDMLFTMVKKGVIERFEYPWFQGKLCSLVKDNMVFSENYSVQHAFCEALKKKGYDIMVDSRIMVKREYNVVF